MADIVKPWDRSGEERDWPDVIRDLYSQGDAAADQGLAQMMDRKPLNQPEDIALIDDVMDALIDPLQAKMARPVLRHALKEIARAALIKGTPPAKA